jgi:hypothetical protein
MQRFVATGRGVPYRSADTQYKADEDHQMTVVAFPDICAETPSQRRGYSTVLFRI